MMVKRWAACLLFMGCLHITQAADPPQFIKCERVSDIDDQPMAILATATDECNATAKLVGSRPLAPRQNAGGNGNSNNVSEPTALNPYTVSCYNKKTTTTALEMVTCRLTIDDRITSVYVGGIKQSVHRDLDSWAHVKTFSFFPEANAVLAISGYEGDNESSGCSTSGLTVACESENKENPWHGFTTDTNSWSAYGSSSSTLSDELSFGWKDNNDVWQSATGTPPCESTSGYSLAGVNTAFPSNDKIWPANGAKYAWFAAAPPKQKSKPITPINLVSNMLTFSEERCADMLEAFPSHRNLFKTVPIPPNWIPIMQINMDAVFEFNSEYWTTSALLNEDSALNETVNAKYATFNTEPFQEIRMCVGCPDANCVHYKFNTPWNNGLALFNSGYIRDTRTTQEEFLAAFAPAPGSYQDCPMQRPGFNVQCKDGNSARWGYCLNCQSQKCQSKDTDDADAAIGIGLTGQDDKGGSAMGAGWTEYFASGAATCSPNSAQFKRVWLWVLNLTETTKNVSVLQCSKFDGKTFLALDQQYCNPVLADMNAALQTTTSTATTTITTTTTMTTTTSSTSTISTADAARSGAAGTAVGIVLGLLCIGGAGFVVWRRKQQQYRNTPARHRVNRRAAKQELERTEKHRNTIQMEDNPLRLSRAGNSTQADYVNVRLPGRQKDGQTNGGKVGDNLSAEGGNGGEKDGAGDHVYYSQIAESALGQHDATYAAPSDASLSADATYSVGGSSGGGGGASEQDVHETPYSVPNDAGAVYETPGGGVMYASSA